MGIVGKVESLWRYPVKSMRGEELMEAFVGFAGVYGDRLYAFRSSSSPKGFPFLTGREEEEMLLYQPVYRHPEPMAKPTNFAEAEAIVSGLTPLYADSAEMMVDVRTPAGETLAIDDPRLIRVLSGRMSDAPEVTLLCSHRAMTDCRPISLFSMQTVRQLGSEVGAELDKRCFRANVYIELASQTGFEEDGFVGRTLRIGAKVEIRVVDRDARCKMITLDPETGKANPDIMRLLARLHEGKAGIYGAVLVEGKIRSGDHVELLS
ncbi:MAG: MOSC domain-containing protein [Acidimicrobiia bacterium]|nr:MOSC domain-containing protein [Acidimicrobiia bacterium]